MAGPPSRGSDSSLWARRADGPPASRESGSAFRSVQRGRGRGRPGGMRGGGRHVSGRVSADMRTSALPRTEDSQGTTNNSDIPKGRAAPNAPNRPSLAVNVLVSQGVMDAPPESPTRSSRRRRPGHKRGASSMQAKPLAPPIADSAPSSPSTQLMQIKDAKDLPPHIASVESSTPVVHDLRQEISSLVDHVRTMAMDNKRPDSPGTHIDWAGEDDDSLPDLDDWFTTSKRPSDTSESEPKTDDNADSAPPVVEVKEEPKAKENPQADVAPPSNSPVVIEQSPLEEKQLEESDSSPPKRERRRQRGGAKKSTSLKTDVPPKKSLLERLSSPTEVPPVSAEVSKPPDSQLGLRKGGGPRSSARQAPREESATSQSLTQSQGKPASVVTEAPVMIIEKVAVKAAAEATSLPDSRPPTNAVPDPEPPKSSRAFDWSDEPMSFDSPPVFDGTPKGPSVDVKPPTPPVEKALLAPPPTSSPASLSVRDRSPRARGQRPQSSDSTPRPSRHDRSPHKTHRANASMPHVSASNTPTGRTRQPHATRPVLRVDALNMIARNLRDTPVRRSSPANSRESL